MYYFQGYKKKSSYPNAVLPKMWGVEGGMDERKKKKLYKSDSL